MRTPSPDAAGESELADYLNHGGCLMIGSQEYHADRGNTDFMTDYLGGRSMRFVFLRQRVASQRKGPLQPDLLGSRGHSYEYTLIVTNKAMHANEVARRGYSAEFRRRVVDLVEGGRKVSEVATELGVSEQTVYVWRRQARIDAGLEAGQDEHDRSDGAQRLREGKCRGNR